jgi:hypothetical protein
MHRQFWSENLKGRTSHKWEYIRNDLQEIGCRDGCGLHSSASRYISVGGGGILNTVTDLLVPLKAGSFFAHSATSS